MILWQRLNCKLVASISRRFAVGRRNKWWLSLAVLIENCAKHELLGISCWSDVCLTLNLIEIIYTKYFFSFHLTKAQ